MKQKHDFDDFEDFFEKPKSKQGKLYLVSTPIGNKDDITFRAVKVMRSCDLIICEDPKIGGRILHQYSISQNLDTLNEQNEEEKTQEFVTMMFQGKEIALISDCGTPVFADPGSELVKAAIRNNIPIEVIPGASSIMTALVRSGFSTEQFLYAGFLNRDKEVRIAELKQLSHENRTVIVFETPYRLMPLLEAAARLMPDRPAYLACNLTLGYETNHYGTFSELYLKFKDLKFKGEFVIIFQGAGGDRKTSRDSSRHEQPRERKFEKHYMDRNEDEYFPRRNENKPEEMPVENRYGNKDEMVHDFVTHRDSDRKPEGRRPDRREGFKPAWKQGKNEGQGGGKFKKRNFDDKHGGRQGDNRKRFGGDRPGGGKGGFGKKKQGGNQKQGE